MVTRLATTWIALLGVMLVMLAFAATASPKASGHLRPNDRGGSLGVGR
jgi:hypothetical protein